MPLTEIDYAPGQDTQQDVYDKTNAAIVDLNDNQIKWKVVNIGDWNMDADSFVNVAHGLDVAKIRVIHGMVRSDDASGYSTIPRVDGATTPNTSAWIFINSANVQLVRETGSSFDGVGWDATSYNRGWITIGYVE